MNEQEIAIAINPIHPYIYGITSCLSRITLRMKDGSIKVGFFHPTEESDFLRKQNAFTFIERGYKAEKFRQTRDKKYATVIKGNELYNITFQNNYSVTYYN
jgi:hypothetical protein